MAYSSDVAAGDEALAAQYNNLRKDALGASLTNQSGVQRVAGDVVIQDTANNSSFTTTTTEADGKIIGVVAETIAAAAAGLVQVYGVCTVTVDAATARGQFLVTSTTAGKATPKTAFQNGVFAVALTAVGGAGSVTALLLPTGLAGQLAYGAILTVPNHDHTGDAGDGAQIALTALNVASQEQGDVIYFGGSLWARLAHGTAGQFLQTGGHGANPSWAADTLAAIASTEQGDVLYYSGAAWVRLAHGTAGQVLQTGGHGANPAWANAGVNFLSTKVYDATSGIPTTWTDLDLSATIGAATHLVYLKVVNKDGATAAQYKFRPNGEAAGDALIGASSLGGNDSGGDGTTVTAGDCGFVLVKTDASGVVEWYSSSSSADTEIYVEAYW